MRRERFEDKALIVPSNTKKPLSTVTRAKSRDAVCSGEICQTVRGVDMLKREAAMSVLWVIRLSG